MTKELLNKCINAIHDKRATGYSFVNSLMLVLMKHNVELCISNIVTVWQVSFTSDQIKYFFDYSNNQEINLDSLDIKGLCEYGSVVTSENREFDDLCERKELLNRFIVAIPINQYSSDSSILPTKGVMIILSQNSKLNISSEQLTFLHSLLNLREPKIFTSINVVKAFKTISSRTHPDKLSYLECYKFIGESLDVISNKSECNFCDSGLRHFSLWQYKSDKDGNISLIKEFNRNTYTGDPHLTTYTSLNDRDNHYLIKTIKKDPINIGMDAKLLSCISYNEACGSFREKEYFENLGLSEKNCTIIVVAVGKSVSCMVSCLYIKNIAYSVFISKELVLHYVQEICRRVFEENIRAKNLLLNKLMIASFENNEERIFYSKAAEEFKKANEAKDCLIYMIDENNTLLLKSETVLRSDFVDINHPLLPDRLLSDKSFVDWFNQWDFNADLPEKFVDYSNPNGTFVNSAMVIQISSKGEIFGLIVLINKDHIPSNDCVFYYNTFIIDNYIITDFCGAFLIQYQQLQNSINSRTYLLSKLRHEIPNNTEAIKFSIQDIRTCLEEPDIKRNYIHVILNNVLLNNTRTYLLANFFSTVDFKSEIFAENKAHVSILHFLNSYIDIFRTEGAFRDVGVYFNMINDNTTIYVSNYFLLAIVNVITNAIRYAAEGTLVYIEIYDDRLIVTDVGIPIRKNEMKHIFKEGYRSDDAKATCEKGMGFGLYLSKMILESHRSKIVPECEFMFDENYYLQKAICDYLCQLSEKERKRFIYNGLERYNYPMADELYKHIRNNNKIDLDMKFFNSQHIDMMQKWLDYLKNGSLVFLDMEDEFFKKEIYKVTFTIYY